MRMCGMVIVLDWKGHKGTFWGDTIVPHLDRRVYHLSKCLYQNWVSCTFKICPVSWCVNYILIFETMKTLSWSHCPLQLPSISLNPIQVKMLNKFSILSVSNSSSSHCLLNWTSLFKINYQWSPVENSKSQFLFVPSLDPAATFGIVYDSLVIETLSHFTSRTLFFLWLVFLPSHWPLLPKIFSWMFLLFPMSNYWYALDLNPEMFL